MSLADDAIRAAAAAYNVVHADEWRILGAGPLAGRTFAGDAQSETVVSLDTDLGSDAREKVTLYVDRPVLALARGMLISGKGATWQIVGDIDDNPANDRVKFEIVKKAAKDS